MVVGPLLNTDFRDFCRWDIDDGLNTQSLLNKAKLEIVTMVTT